MIQRGAWLCAVSYYAEISPQILMIDSVQCDTARSLTPRCMILREDWLCPVWYCTEIRKNSIISAKMKPKTQNILICWSWPRPVQMMKNWGRKSPWTVPLSNEVYKHFRFTQRPTVPLIVGTAPDLRWILLREAKLHWAKWATQILAPGSGLHKSLHLVPAPQILAPGSGLQPDCWSHNKIQFSHTSSSTVNLYRFLIRL